jgi:hypothetical protein
MPVYFCQKANAAVDDNLKFRKFIFQSVYQFIPQWRNFAILSGTQPTQPSFAGMDNKCAASSRSELLDELSKIVKCVFLIDSDSAFDCYWNTDTILHHLKTLGNPTWFEHKTHPKTSGLHPIARTAHIDIDLIKTCFFAQLRAVCHLERVASTEL